MKYIYQLLILQLRSFSTLTNLKILHNPLVTPAKLIYLSYRQEQLFQQTPMYHPALVKKYQVSSGMKVDIRFFHILY